MTDTLTPRAEQQEAPRGGLEKMRRFFATLGPGVVAGAADDDPSGIATYSIAGAQFGTSLLWLAPLTWPLMAVIQMMCARIGMVTGADLLARCARSSRAGYSLLSGFSYSSQTRSMLPRTSQAWLTPPS